MVIDERFGEAMAMLGDALAVVERLPQSGVASCHISHAIDLLALAQAATTPGARPLPHARKPA